MRHGDDQWLDVVKWTLYAMINAEELAITQKNVDEMAKSSKPELRRVVWMGQYCDLASTVAINKRAQTGLKRERELLEAEIRQHRRQSNGQHSDE